MKSAGILGDDIAVGAKKATGFENSRELQVIYKIMKGSFLNKVYIIIGVFLLNFLYSPVITYILICGGFYLAYEGAEGVYHWIKKDKHHDNNNNNNNNNNKKKYLKMKKSKEQLKQI